MPVVICTQMQVQSRGLKAYMTTINIKNMVCRHCVAAVRKALTGLGLDVAEVVLGRATINGGPLPPDTLAAVDKTFKALGFIRIDDPEAVLVEKIKHAVLHHVRDEEECRLNLSACIEEHVGGSYDHLSRIFSAREGRTIEKFHIAQKVELVKELLGYGELPLAEIAFRTGYSSTAHLSRQFKEITGLTPTQYIKSAPSRRDLSEA